MLHIHCGDSSAEILRSGGIDGEVIVWSDTLHDGHVPDCADAGEFRKVRAAFLSQGTGGAISVERCMKKLSLQDAAFEKIKEHEEAVLWFDACLYDQLILVCLLSRIYGMKLQNTKLSLICIGEFPGFLKFKGLGELNAGQLLSLYPSKHEVSEKEFETAVEAWKVFRSASPSGINEFIGKDSSCLPYLREAFIRFSEQYPSEKNGLNRIQNSILKAVLEGAGNPVDIFKAVSDMEKRPFFGDTTLYGYINYLSLRQKALLELNGPGKLLPQWDTANIREWRVKITETGKDIFSGNADMIKLNGIDTYLGGVHLKPGNIWRCSENALLSVAN